MISGSAIDKNVGCSSASNSLNNISAITSSNMAAAIIN